ncbi:MAG: zinc metallopeptidase [Tannerella sp.]|jgi:predicted metalloprotease|nr:zinc metallopeptidase [Tannerella sp.]
MKLDGRRESQNVDDRRGKGFGRGKASLGLGGVIVVGFIVWLLGGNPLDFVSMQLSEGGASVENYTRTPEEEQMATFAKRILAGTEDVWTKIFRERGKEYTPPRMVLFHRAVQSGCGNATSSTGPFYCSADQTVYIDLSFFSEMEQRLNAGGDFAYAYVIAHEVGHHVQYLLGTLDEVHRNQQRVGQVESNRLNVRLELQADFYAGIWAYYDNKMFDSIEEGDIEEGLNAASQIGDDRLQMESQGYTVPDAFNHGTSAQRSRWLKKGLQTGDITFGDTFSVDYSNL